MKLTTTRRSIPGITTMLANITLSIVVTAVGVLRMHPAIATPPPQLSLLLQPPTPA